MMGLAGILNASCSSIDEGDLPFGLLLAAGPAIRPGQGREAPQRAMIRSKIFAGDIA